MTDGCGLNFSDSLLRFDPHTECWRTCQESILPVQPSQKSKTTSKLTWPTAGMTQNGVCYPQKHWAERMSGIDSFLSASGVTKMYPTPSATPRGPHTGEKAGTIINDGRTRVSAKGAKFGATLQTAVYHEEGSGNLAPAFVEQLMGFPIGWTDCED